MTSSLLYTRVFSAISNIQQPYSIAYSLTRTDAPDGAVYGIMVSRERLGSAVCETMPNVSQDESEVRDMLQFLYENAIDTEQVLDIVGDIVARY